MPEFFNVLPPDEARELLLSRIHVALRTERSATEAALGRVTVEPIHAPHALPSFRRSTMDGYAVRAADTFGATESLPAFLRVVAEVAMGRPADIALAAGEAAIIHTGGMIPDSADAVVQVEHTSALAATIGSAEPAAPPFEIEVLRPVAVGQNVLQIGEDVQQAAEILPAGHRLRPQDLGGLLALGITDVHVAARPRVAILASGDEVVEPSVFPAPGQIRDINSFTIAGQVQQAGGLPLRCGIVADDFASLKAAAGEALAAADMLVMTAGSSVSVRDMTVRVIDELGEPGVLLHGVATRPGKPTIVGVVGGKPVLGLPGNPVSAMIQFDMFGAPAVYHLQGMVKMPQRSRVWARLTQNIASENGREDYVPVRLREGIAHEGTASEDEQSITATPVFGKSNLIYTLVNADGLIKVPLNKGGLLAGELVEVRLF